MYRIMLADDYSMIREILREYLKQNTPELEVIAEAANGQEAVEFAEQYQPDLILMDVRMPVLDGIEAVGRIKARHPEIIAITYSGCQEEDLLSRSHQAGAAAHFTKPFALSSLLKKVMEVLAEKEAPSDQAAQGL